MKTLISNLKIVSATLLSVGIVFLSISPAQASEEVIIIPNEESPAAESVPETQVEVPLVTASSSEEQITIVPAPIEQVTEEVIVEPLIEEPVLEIVEVEPAPLEPEAEKPADLPPPFELEERHELPQVFIRSSIAPVGIPKPSGIAKAVPAPIAPNKIRSVPVITPPPLVPIKEPLSATTTEEIIVATTSDSIEPPSEPATTSVPSIPEQPSDDVVLPEPNPVEEVIIPGTDSPMATTTEEEIGIEPIIDGEPEPGTDYVESGEQPVDATEPEEIVPEVTPEVVPEAS